MAAEQRSTKQCSSCGEIKPINDFPPRKDSRDGKRGSCRKCRSSAQHLEYLGNRDTIIARSREWQKQNREVVKASQRARRQNRHDEVLDYARAYYLENGDRIRKQRRENYAANPDRAKRANAKYHDANPGLKAEWNRNRKAKVRAASGKHTHADILELFFVQKGKCAYCRKRLKPGYHVDHIMPIALGGSNAKSNLQLTCSSCNYQKNANHPVDFARRLGRLL